MALDYATLCLEEIYNKQNRYYMTDFEYKLIRI